MLLALLCVAFVSRPYICYVVVIFKYDIGRYASYILASSLKMSFLLFNISYLYLNSLLSNMQNKGLTSR